MAVLPSSPFFYDIEVFEETLQSSVRYPLIGLSEVIPLPHVRLWLHVIGSDSLPSVGALSVCGISGSLIHWTRVVSARSLRYQVATFVLMVSHLLSDPLTVWCLVCV